MQSPFFELSVELLEQIIAYLDVEGHLTLCLLSRQVHQYLLPGFLRRWDVRLSSDLTTLEALSFHTNIDIENAILKLVSASPCIKNIGHLECIFHPHESRILWQFANILSVLRKVQSIESVTLDFSKFDSEWALHASSSPQAIQHRQTWSDLFFHVMKALVDKPFCKLTVIGRNPALWFIPHPFRYQYVPSNGLVHGARQADLVQRGIWTIRCGVARLVSLSTSQPHTSLGNVDLSCITCLTLRDCNLDIQEWEAMAWGLTFPSLREVRTKMGLSLTMNTLRHLLKFLKRHPSITLLHLHEYCIWPTSTFRSRGFLPKLKSLHAPISLVYAFFGDKFIKANVELTDLELVYYPYDDFEWSELFDWVDGLPQTLQGVPTTMEVRLDASWLISSVPPPSNHNAVVSLSRLDVDFNLADGFPAGVGGYPSIADFWWQVQAWLMHFPDLKWLCIRRLCGPRARHAELVEAIFTCGTMTSLRKIDINDRVYLRGIL
ncbi:hypothetical protein ONZ45_g807 [Pleurotus djamor]|nr:hypothetical protein ONZ45_g807 [Pleurotus djamor]